MPFQLEEVDLEAPRADEILVRVAASGFEFPPMLRQLMDERAKGLEEPLTGITTDGVVRKGLFSLTPTGVSTGPITEAAQTFLGELLAEPRQQAVFPLDAAEKRMWINIEGYVFRHGIMLEDLSSRVRELALDLLRATLSARGFAQARDIMKLNRLAGELSNSPEAFGEWPYFLSFFGEPSQDTPWAWQIEGHHLCATFTIIGDHLVFTPTFMGSEPCHGVRRSTCRHDGVLH
jgi:hypothetical protein